MVEFVTHLQDDGERWATVVEAIAHQTSMPLFQSGARFFLASNKGKNVLSASLLCFTRRSCNYHMIVSQWHCTDHTLHAVNKKPWKNRDFVLGSKRNVKEKGQCIVCCPIKWNKYAQYSNYFEIAFSLKKMI